MKIYRIKLIADQCQWVMPSDPEFVARGGVFFDGTPKSADWSPPEFYIHNPVAPKSNFYILNPSALCFDKEISKHPLLVAFFEMAGEILPIRLESGGQLYVFNITGCINALDQHETVWRLNPNTAAKVAITKYAFRPERRSESSLFKLPETRRSEILLMNNCSVALNGDFISAYQESGLVGLDFEQVWTDDV